MIVRCGSCSHSLNCEQERPVKLLALFRRPKDGRALQPSDVPWFSRRCRHCQWINLFEVMDAVIAAT